MDNYLVHALIPEFKHRSERCVGYVNVHLKKQPFWKNNPTKFYFSLYFKMFRSY